MILIKSLNIYLDRNRVVDLKNIDMHLNEFQKYNVTAHDSIDDKDQEHGHTHKHGKDGEEHEHNHDHSKVGQSIIKVLSNSNKLISLSIKLKSKKIFYQKILVSNPHPIGIFRPPIS